MTRTNGYTQYVRVILSDLHFGDRRGCDLLRYRWAQESLWPLLQEADELILLGDTWELAFQSFVTAIDASRLFFQELSRRCPHIVVRFLPGNHDHHFVLRAADERKEAVALRQSLPRNFSVPPAERIIKTLAPQLEVSSHYPFWAEDGIWYHHGHYLSTHLDSWGWRAFERMQWKVWGQPRRHQGLTAIDYESLISPLHELSYQVAQLPQGTDSQVALEAQLAKLATVIRIPVSVKEHVAEWRNGRGLRARERGPVITGEAAARALDDALAMREIEPRSHQANIAALLQVLENLGVQERQVIIGHTHEPNAGERAGRWMVHNCGSWFYDYRTVSKNGSMRILPGSALVVEGNDIRLHQLLTMKQLEDFERGGTL